MKLLRDLAATSSRLHKEHLLKDIAYEDWQTFVTAYDPYKMYYVRFKEYDMDNLGEPNRMMFNLLERLAVREITGNEARTAVERHAEMFGDLIKLVCNKDLRCGVTATLFNNVHPTSIPQFEVQLAKEVPLEKLNYPILAQIKFDGVRLIIINNAGEITFRTRKGKTVELPKVRELLSIRMPSNWVLDTEVTFETGKPEDRTKISGMINSAMHGGAIDETNLVFNAFDCMPINMWYETKCSAPYTERYNTLSMLLTKIEAQAFRIAYTLELQSAEEAASFYNVAIEEGYEGLILKPADHLYTFKRSKDWVKMKEVKTADLTCEGIQKGEGKYEDQIGALVCTGIVEGQEIKVNVGSGLTDHDRSRSYEHYLGKTIEIKYNSLIQDQTTGLYSLFLPRFVDVRFDK